MPISRGLHLIFAVLRSVQGVDMFGKRVGFLKFKADIVDEETKTKVINLTYSSLVPVFVFFHVDQLLSWLEVVWD